MGIKKTKDTPEGQSAAADFLVQKSNPLMALGRSELSLPELKIFDAYLARINSHEPEKRTVQLEKGEIEAYLGVKKINVADLKARLKHLGIMVPVDDPDGKNAFRMISLLEQMSCVQGDDGLWRVSLTCTQAAMQYIFCVEDFGYTKYALSTVTKLGSRYAYVLFLYLLKASKMHSSWEVEVDPLREMLKANEPSYQQFKFFNSLILRPSQQEITERTDFRFSYEPVRVGRSVKRVRFTVHATYNGQAKAVLPLTDEDSGSTESEPWRTSGDVVFEASNGVFTKEEAQVIADAILPLLPHARNRDERFVLLFDETTRLLHKLEAQSSRKPIQNKYQYMLKMLENEPPIQPPVETPDDGDGATERELNKLRAARMRMDGKDE